MFQNFNKKKLISNSEENWWQNLNLFAFDIKSNPIASNSTMITLEEIINHCNIWRYLRPVTQCRSQ